MWNIVTVLKHGIEIIIIIIVIIIEINEPKLTYPKLLKFYVLPTVSV